MIENFGKYISDQQWAQYYRDGYIKLGKVLDDEALATLQERINAIMLGEADVDYERMMMQLDSTTGAYGDAGEQSKGFKGATLDYRKIEQLEFDPIFLDYMQQPIFRELCAGIYGAHTPIASFRAMFMNKPAGKGTLLPWHQDRWNHLDRDPLITVWTALDPATVENGCVQIIRGSHKWGVINPEHGSGFLSPEQAEKYAPKDEVIYCELEPGEVMLLHNWLLHASDKNHSEVSRRAFSVCYMDARTKNESLGAEVGSRIFGDGALEVSDLSRRGTVRNSV
jgi:ectoine hydroxylase-related dioxygenase (phytanoyl-CoA dioxygenase family)